MLLILGVVALIIDQWLQLHGRSTSSSNPFLGMAMEERDRSVFNHGPSECEIALGLI